MKKLIIGSILTLFITNGYTENTINTETNSWKNIPIQVDEDNKTFTTSEGFLLPEGNYYYSFTGYRCLREKSNTTNEEPIVLTDTKHSEIYCYKDK